MADLGGREVEPAGAAVQFVVEGAGEEYERLQLPGVRGRVDAAEERELVTFEVLVLLGRVGRLLETPEHRVVDRVPLGRLGALA